MLQLLSHSCPRDINDALFSCGTTIASFALDDSWDGSGSWPDTDEDIVVALGRHMLHYCDSTVCGIMFLSISIQ